MTYGTRRAAERLSGIGKKENWRRELKRAISFINQNYFDHYFTLERIAILRGKYPQEIPVEQMIPQDLFEYFFTQFFNQYKIEKYTGFNEQDITFEKNIHLLNLQVRGKYKTKGGPIDLSAILTSEWKEKQLVPTPRFVRDEKDTELTYFTKFLDLSVYGVQKELIYSALEKNFKWNYISIGDDFFGDTVLSHKYYTDGELTNYSIPVKVKIKSEESLKFKAEFSGKTWKS